jgi:tRNA(adenine34) deaminase
VNEFFKAAFAEAEKAAKQGEVPIGAVIVRNGKIIAKGRNQRERKQNALYHAEILAIGRACKKLKSWRLDDCELYVTLEPCEMCRGACANARIKTVYFGAKSTSDLNWSVNFVDLGDESSKQLLKDFFAKNR